MRNELMGRPEKEVVKDRYFVVRVSEKEREDLKNRAKQGGVSVSKMVRTVLFGSDDVNYPFKKDAKGQT